MIGDRNQKQVILDQLRNPRPQQQIQKKKQQKQLLDLLKHKNQQIAILHQVNSRLGSQLATLQNKLGIDHDIILKELESLGEISVAFHYQTQQLIYLDHLLKSYDENNLKQKKLIALLYSQLEDSEKKAQNLVKENTFLLTQMQEKCKQILQIYNKGFPEDNLVAAYNKLQIDTQNQRIETIKQQNEYLTNHYYQLQNNYKKIIKQFQQSKKNAQKYFQLYQKQSQQLKDSLIKVDDLLKIKQVLQNKFQQISQQNLQLQTNKNHLENKLNRLQNDYKSLKNQFFTIKKNNAQQLQKINIQNDTLKIEIQSSQKRQRQIFQKSMIMEKQFQNLKDNYKKIKKDLQHVKNDFQQTLKMCQAYQNKMNHFQKKQENYKNIIDQHKQNLDKILLERDKALLKQQQLEKFIENIQSKNRDEIQTVKNTYQKIIYSQNQKIKVLEDSREDVETTYSQNQFTYKNQIQKLRKQNTMLRQENSKFIRNLKATSENEIGVRIRQLQERNESLTKILAQKQRALHDEIENKDDLVRNLESQNRDLSRQVDKQRNSARQAINQRTQYKSKISILQKQKQCLEDQISRLKRSIDSKMNNNRDQHQWKLKDLQYKLGQALNKEKNTRQKAIEMLEKYDQAEEKLKGQYQNRIRQLQAENQRLRKKLHQD